MGMQANVHIGAGPSNTPGVAASPRGSPHMLAGPPADPVDAPADGNVLICIVIDL
jgi:hypothetical protein